ncbi:MAG: hypothetical protein U0792_20150 [Gemmataceae bacterium]
MNANLDDDRRNSTSTCLKREKGHVGFQSYNVRVEFRNVYIGELK